MDKRQCICCGDNFIPRSQVKGQKYCRKPECQRARRAKWLREKLKEDTDYRDEKKRCQAEWQKSHPGYWREYRRRNPSYTARNRQRQYIRDARRRKKGLMKMLAKIDVLTRPHYSRRGGFFRLISQSNRLLAKKYVSIVKLIPTDRVSWP